MAARAEPSRKSWPATSSRLRYRAPPRAADSLVRRDPRADDREPGIGCSAQ